MGEVILKQFDKDAYLASVKERSKRIVVDDSCLTINVNDDYKYEIELNRIDDAVKILQWTIHLTEKTWMTTELMRQFLFAACSKAGINPNHLPA